MTCALTSLQAQEIPPLDTLPPTLKDSIAAVISDSIVTHFDSLLTDIRVDSLPGIADSTLQQADSIVFTSNTVRFSKDSLDQEVESYGRDSMQYDIANKLVHLWGDAYVKYGTITLKADYIIYNWTDNIVTAEHTLDSLGKKVGRPEFSDESQSFTANKMRYNFKTQKGVVFDAVSTYNDLYVHGSKAKFKGKGADTLHQDEHMYSKDAIFTTCNHPHPHFGIRSNKQKVVPDKVVVVGPSNLEIGGVPTPVWLPFGFFPLKQGERTGLMFGNYEFSESLGFGLLDFGWYFPISEQMNLVLLGDIYTRGTYRLDARSQYAKRYKYTGLLNLSYSNRRVESGVDFVSDHYFGIRWTHTQAQKAHPYNTFGGGVNIETNNNQSQNRDDFNSTFQNTLSSNIKFTRKFIDKPLTLSASFDHSQNTQSREVRVAFPNINFFMNQIFPFKRKKGSGGGDEKWYETISFKYDANLRNEFLATDTTIFTRQTLTDARYGVKHKIATSARIPFLQYLNVTPRFDYTEVWHFKTLEKTFDPNPVVDSILIDTLEMIYQFDTTSYGSVNEMVNNGFKPLRLFSTGVNVNTRLFGTLLFKKGWLRGLRHVIEPNLGFNYTPDYTRSGWGYFETVQTDSRQEDESEYEQYSVFQSGVFGDRPSNQGQRMSLDYSLGNRFEGKYWSKRDSSFNKFKILDNIGMNGGYNFAADSFRHDVVTMNTRAQLLASVSRLMLNASFDPYVFEGGRRVNRLMWNEEKKLFRFVRATAGLSNQLKVGQLAGLLSGNGIKKGGRTGGQRDKGPQGIGSQSLLDLIENFSIRHEFKVTLERIGDDMERDTFRVTAHTIGINGNLQLTDKWRLSIGNITYNFKTKSLVYPTLSIYRDLHCWELSMNWTPGANSYRVSLHVKPGSLDFIKVPYQQNPFGGF